MRRLLSTGDFLIEDFLVRETRAHLSRSHLYVGGRNNSGSHLLLLQDGASVLLPFGPGHLLLVALVFYQVLLLHASGLFQIGVLDAPSWSISAEWFAYLLFPLYFFLVSRFIKIPNFTF